MKAFVKTCWLELALFALGLLAGLGAQPFLPEAVPRQWQGGQVVSTMPKLCLLLVPVIQLAVTMTVRAVLGAQMKKSPALAGVPRVLSAVVAVVCLVLGGLCVLGAPIVCMLRDMKRGG